jgi:hypothetical protein
MATGTGAHLTRSMTEPSPNQTLHLTGAAVSRDTVPSGGRESGGTGLGLAIAERVTRLAVDAPR